MLIGLDIGTSSVKAVAVDRNGDVLKVAERPYSPRRPRPGWSEQDPEDWWRAAEDALDECGAHHCDGIGLSGQMHGLVALDGRDEPLRPAILWNDSRAYEQCRAIEERLGLEGFVAHTGNRALAGCTAPSLLWVRDHEPEVYERIAAILLPKDYVRLKLTGERATDAVDASGTLLFDVARRSWSSHVLSALELDPAWLPPVHESPAPAGRLDGRVPVAAGAGDEAAAAVGAGVVKQGDPVSIVLGTSGVVVAALDGYAADAQGRAHSYCHAVPNGWNVLGVTLSAGGSLRWLRDVLEPNASFRRLIHEATAWEPGTQGLLFAPQLAGERMPHADPKARGGFVGLGTHHDRGALARAVLEGVAFSVRESLELLDGLAGRPVKARVSGGGARSDVWLEILAAVLDLPLEICHVQEGGAYGAALLGGVAAGLWLDVEEAVSETVRVTRVVEPRADWVERYAELRPFYDALYPGLHGIQHAAD
ncbi:xylulokinase [Candidatus Solirubrobacter pratensis]|uniref:xylulokinase n=1 Tax=Candidatus Solirubrobacter pratensis TaxID=1298857 RepID=UPI00040B29CC|nr:xylulokinase [Candidatus Solirubrobacter pratensis]